MHFVPSFFAPAWLGVVLLFAGTGVRAESLPDFTVLVETFGPAVVNISSSQSDHGEIPGMGAEDDTLPEDSPLYDFFRRFFGDEGEMPDFGGEGRSLGSGFLISSDGYVVTNSHVVEMAEEIIVRTSDRREFVASVIGADERSDIALLKVDAQDLPQVEIGQAANLKVGEWVLAIGSPFGFEHSATAGIVSAKGRSLPSENYVPFIQTDVAINPGNSGGPLFNLDGQVIGVNSQIYSRTGGFMGLSFAIPIEVVMDVVEQLRTQGRVTRGWLGVLIQDVTRELAETFALTRPRGALVAQVVPGSPAAAAGVLAGDVILRFDGQDVVTSGDLPPLVGMAKVGDKAKIELLRQGQPLSLEVLLAELPENGQEELSAPLPEETAANAIGLVLSDLTAEQRDRFELAEGGVLIEEVASGPAAQAGLRPGDVILAFDGVDVRDLAHFRELLAAAEPARPVAVLIQRGAGRMFYPLGIPDHDETANGD
ncbi:DegQ family serine endoprotease [Thiorhodovibrio frisius]|uniref:Probable periplasmic serine endoprotease DegP-like n=1 Tax=Thiorhodovibrio frisius TaxID=631362 RepID=H8Z277_9GAMM|nr:DegQ family serine endoprotease [Thiorhodovibrio frisius]EIC22639.1 periplasmic serine protease, Do/DeqQ family [Thiorhodovibrio frisius]WPL22395.1 putative periplasmic serine endoprotease DegP-like precursor [Thiorhodovibrio frisius]